MTASPVHTFPVTSKRGSVLSHSRSNDETRFWRDGRLVLTVGCPESGCLAVGGLCSKPLPDWVPPSGRTYVALPRPKRQKASGLRALLCSSRGTDNRTESRPS